MQQYSNFTELLAMRADIQGKDAWQVPGSTTVYKSSKLYKLLRPFPVAPKPFQWIWKACVLPKHKFFFWLMIQDRINTRDLLTRKQFQIPSNECVLCDVTPIEDLYHLFFGCQFSKDFWHALGFIWNDTDDHMALMQHGKIQYKHICFKEVLIIGSWALWNHRNKIIFDGDNRDLSLCISFF